MDYSGNAADLPDMELSDDANDASVAEEVRDLAILLVGPGATTLSVIRVAGAGAPDGQVGQEGHLRAKGTSGARVSSVAVVPFTYFVVML